MSQAGIDLAVWISRVIEQEGLGGMLGMKEPAQASEPGQAEVMQGEEVCVQTEGETVGWNTATVSHPSDGVKRSRLGEDE